VEGGGIFYLVSLLSEIGGYMGVASEASVSTYVEGVV
jgi:hypothetical protein